MSLSDAPADGLRDAIPFPATSAPRAAEDTALDSLRARLLRAGREAVDDRELLQLLLAGSHSAAEAHHLAGVLMHTFGSTPRVLAARPDTLRAVAGLGEAGIAAIKTAEALGIRMAKAALPDTFHPQLATYEKVVEYCRTLAGHRDVEEFRAIYLDTKNRLIRDERHSSGTINHTPVYPRQVCVPRAGGRRSRPCRTPPAPVERPHAVAGRRRDDQPPARRPQDDRRRPPRPRHRHPGGRVQLQGKRPPLAGTPRPSRTHRHGSQFGRPIALRRQEHGGRRRGQAGRSVAGGPSCAASVPASPQPVTGARSMLDAHPAPPAPRTSARRRTPRHRNRRTRRAAGCRPQPSARP